MKRTRILIRLLLMFSLVTVMGLSSFLNYSTNQTSKTSLINPSERDMSFQAVENGLDSSNEIDLEKLAAERNAQMEHSEQISRGSAPQKELIGEFKLTFYTPSPDETDNSPSITATGAQVKPGITVAVDPRHWEMGTKFYIEGYGYVVADDTGSKIKGPRTIDVCVETKDQALKNGVQYRNVWVVEA